MVKGILREKRGFYALTSVSKPALLLEISAQIDRHLIPVMVDCAAEGNFMSPSLIDRCEISVKKKDQAYDLIAIDENPLLKQDGRVTQETPTLSILIEPHYEEICFDILAMARHDVVLGLPWLHQHNSLLDWRRRVLSFG